MARLYPQVKVCGLTTPEQAAACAALGVAAIGLVFYPPSPRYVTPDQARAIVQCLPAQVPAVGVFVDPEPAELEFMIDHCGLRAVQLHGNEPPELLRRLRQSCAVTVIKGLFSRRPPLISAAVRYAADAFLLECGQGVLPGGNARTWDWGAAADFAADHVTLLAGGLTPENVAAAIAACRPDGVDASSGLEVAPGYKAMDKVARFIQNVRGCAKYYQDWARTIRPVF